MSFSSQMKSELVNINEEPCCKIAELSALLKMNGSISLSSSSLWVEFVTSNIQIARKIVKSIKELFSVNVEILSKKQMKLKKNDQYIIRIVEHANEIANRLGLFGFDDGIDVISPKIIEKECCKRAYIRGAFLAGGSINNPNTSSYHLEIFVHEEQLAMELARLLNDFHLKAKYIHKKSGFIVYIKEAEKISDFIRVVGSVNALLEFEDVRIKRDFINSINRVNNCDIANQKKTLASAKVQMEYIIYLKEYVEESRLPESVKQAMFLRETYQDCSLQELSELSEEHFGKIISKSALNHRFRNMKEIVMSHKENQYD